MAPTIVTFANNKGGVGKTSLGTALVAAAAERGQRCLVVDLDKQGNAAPRFGLEKHDDANDKGASMLGAVLLNQPLRAVTVRPHIDVGPGGAHAKDLAGQLFMRSGAEGVGALAVLRDKIREFAADRYDLVVIDTPVDTTIMTAALIAADWLVLPTKVDLDSTESMAEVAELFNGVRAKGLSNVELAGVVLFGVDPTATRLEAEMREYVNALLGGTGACFARTIRHSQVSSSGMRELGLSASEYASQAAAQEPWYKRRGKQRDPEAHVFASKGATANLAADYEALMGEILDRIGMLAATTTSEPDTAEQAVG
ncbi:MAG TPA: ParA family protein [Acidimicrobiales bacterium]|nr:ParA family protein [Acidimicrobiales bacterium]